MEQSQILTFVGMPGAGKSSCAEYLVSKGYPSVYFGGIILDELKDKGLPINEANEKRIREDVRAIEGKDAFAQRVIKKIEALLAEGYPRIVVDGLYSWSEYKIFKEKFGASAVVVAIVSPRYLRHKRLANRPVRPLTEKEANERDFAEIENLEKGGPIANADYTLLNDTERIDDLFDELDKVLEKINF